MTRRAFIGMLLGAALIPGSLSQVGVAQPKLEDGLIGYWKFDEGQGDKVIDASPSKNDGILLFGPQWVEGRLGKALRFDGVNAMVEIPHRDVLKQLSAITISVWLRLMGPADQAGEKQWHGIIGADGWFHGYRLEIRDSDKVVSFQLTAKEGNQVFSATKLQINVWYHLVATYDAKAMKLYINGQKDPNEQARTGPINPNQSPLRIGKAQYAFNGIIDDVRIYNRALSAEEIDMLYRLAGT